MDYQRRFGGLARLYGEAGLAAFAAARVCVIGVGGVGSWTVEALARSAVGSITLIDLDHLSESNMNRQLPAIEPDLGRAKVDALRDRVGQINPDCRVVTIEEFVTADNVETLVAPNHDWVIDCIDDARAKAGLIACCRRRGQAIVTIGGAGGQIDATRVHVSDLRKTEQDPLLARTRRLLRREYSFPTDPRHRFQVPSVWSDEPQRSPPLDSAGSVEGSLNCAGYGACMPVTATFGLAAAGFVIGQLSVSRLASESSNDGPREDA